MKNHHVCLLFSVSILCACSVKISDSGDAKSGDELPVLEQSTGPLAGQINGGPWRAARAIARASGSDLQIMIAGEGVELNCSYWGARQPQIALLVPPTTGTYPYQPNASGRPVNVVFMAQDGSPLNVVAVKSLIVIDVVAVDRVEGTVAAISDLKTQPNYKFSGRFVAERCK